jgi:hypothetical protein
MPDPGTRATKIVRAMSIVSDRTKQAKCLPKTLAANAVKPGTLGGVILNRGSGLYCVF